jgi:hypothetical protein
MTSATGTTSDADYLKEICVQSIDWENTADPAASAKFDELAAAAMPEGRSSGSKRGKGLCSEGLR